MKKPENFRKIDSVIFTTRTGNTYKFSTDGRSPELWIFQQPDTTQYALAFIIDWECEVYEIKRVKNGDGTNWIDTIHKGNFTNEPMKTISSFVDWVHHRILQFEYEYNKLYDMAHLIPNNSVTPKPKPIFVMRFRNSMVDSEFGHVRDTLFKSPLADDYHIITLRNNKDTDEFEMYNADKIERQDWNELVNKILK